MGGVAGGMAHLYNDPSLSFNDIKKILSAASRGELEGTEKTDGYNTVSYTHLTLPTTPYV